MPPPASALKPSIFEFQKPTMPTPASAPKPSIFEFQKPSMSTPASATKRMSIFEFSKPLISSPASTSIFDFQKPGTSAPGSSTKPLFGKPGTSGLGSAPNLAIFDFQTSGKSTPALASPILFDSKLDMSSPSGSKSRSIFDFAESSKSTSVHRDTRPAKKYIGPAGTRKPLTASQVHESQSQGKGEVVILPAVPGKAIVFAPGPFIAYTQDRSTPRPPPSTELIDLDPNSPRARGLCQKYNIAVRSDEACVDRSVANVAQAFAKVWERAMDPDASTDPTIRNLQAALDTMLTRGEEFTEMDRMDLTYGDIHREALKTLPDKITTTSHYRYVLASFRREKDRLREQIQSDRDLVAAMDATLDALKPFIDKGKGRDRG